MEHNDLRSAIAEAEMWKEQYEQLAYRAKRESDNMHEANVKLQERIYELESELSKLRAEKAGGFKHVTFKGKITSMFVKHVDFKVLYEDAEMAVDVLADRDATGEFDDVEGAIESNFYSICCSKCMSDVDSIDDLVEVDGKMVCRHCVNH